MIKLKTTLATFFSFSVTTSAVAFGMSTYTNDYGKGTAEVQYKDFKLLLPKNWTEVDTGNDDSLMFTIMNDNDITEGYVGLFSEEFEYLEDFCDYPVSVLESMLSDTFLWSNPCKFEEYPILSDTEHGYFAASEQDISGDSVKSYALSFNYNKKLYCFFVNIYSDVDSDYSFDIAHVFNSICYNDNVSTDETTATESENLEDIGYGPGQYKVGTDLPSGEYYVLALYDGIHGYFSVTSDANDDNIILNDIFDVNSIVSVNDGEYLSLDDATAIPSSLFEAGYTINYQDFTSGTLKVGHDIQPGEYKLTASGDSSAYWSIYSNARHDIVSNDYFDGSSYVTLSDGQYFNYEDCTISQ